MSEEQCGGHNEPFSQMACREGRRFLIGAQTSMVPRIDIEIQIKFQFDRIGKKKTYIGC